MGGAWGCKAIFHGLQMSQIQPKEKWRFLQKYWHKGAFFQETSDNPYSRDQVDDVYARDYSAPTGEDKLDKSVLPKVMQVSYCPHPKSCCALGMLLVHTDRLWGHLINFFYCFLALAVLCR